MKLSKDEVRHLAKLARLQLSEEEIQRLAHELGGILEYIYMLREVNTEGVSETFQVTGLANVTREDEVKEELCDPQELLACSPLPQQAGQIRIKKMM